MLLYHIINTLLLKIKMIFLKVNITNNINLLLDYKTEIIYFEVFIFYPTQFTPIKYSIS